MSLTISSKTLEWGSLSYYFEPNSSLPILKSQNSDVLSFNTKTYILAIQFMDKQKLFEAIGSHVIIFNLTDAESYTANTIQVSFIDMLLQPSTDLVN